MRILITKPGKETIYVHPAYQENQPLQLLMAGVTHPDPGYHISRPGNNGLYVLEYVVSGKGHVRFGDMNFSPVAGDVYFLQPYAFVDYHSDEKDPWEKVWFNIRGPLIESLCKGYGLNGLIYYRSCPLEKMFLEALALAREWHGEAHSLSLQIHRILAALHDWKKQHPEYQKSPEGICLKEYLDQHWQEKIQLKDLAELIGKSPVQVLRIFQRDWEDTPNNYLQRLRNGFACQYLENTNFSIKEIAGMLGFQDEFYFSNWFKAKNGSAPLTYRRKFR